MTPAEIKQARQSLGLSAAKLGRVLGTNGRTVRSWECDPSLRSARVPSRTAVVALQWLLDGWRPRDWPG